MTDNRSNTKRIVKNTIILYVRMIVIMLITLYSSRIILKALGIGDYGLYNVVGGVVLMLGFLKSSLTSATQRFLSFEMGRHETDRLQKVFSLCLTTHILISIIIVLLAETIGLWFLNTHIQIPDGRETAANWVFHYSVFSMAISLITVPYHACTISHERMSFFAWVSILDAVLKLAFAFAIMYAPYDRLSFYAFLMMLTHFINLFLYWLYCKKSFFETNYRFVWDKKMFKDIFSFSGWTMWGQLAVVGSVQGKGILVNIFHSVVANAAMGVAHQVNVALVSLTSNFQTAFQPQITKSYAAKDYEYMNTLINSASKISFFLLFIVSLPFMLNIDWVLSIWLTEVPAYSGTFCNLYIIASILNALSTPLWIAIFATGKIKNYQIVVSATYFMELLVIYILFLLGFPPTTAMVVKVVLNVAMIIVRLIFTQNKVEFFSALNYTRNVLVPLLLSSLVTILPLIFFLVFREQKIELISTIIICAISILSAYYIGLSHRERTMVVNLIKKHIK